jgi:hypothetical protein
VPRRDSRRIAFALARIASGESSPIATNHLPLRA